MTLLNDAREIVASMKAESGVSWRVFAAGIGADHHRNLMRWVAANRSATPRLALRGAADSLPITPAQRALLLQAAGVSEPHDPTDDAGRTRWARELAATPGAIAELPSLDRARGRLDFVQLLINVSQYARAFFELGEIARDHPAELDDPRTMAVWLTRRAWIAHYTGNPQGAIADLRRVLGLARATGDVEMAVHAHHFVGRSYAALALACRPGSRRLAALAARSFELSRRGLARVGSDEQLAYAHLREAELSRACHRRDLYDRHLARARDLFGGSDGSWHHALEEAGDVELRPKARRNRAEAALFGAWRLGYPRGIAAGHVRLAELLASSNTRESLLPAADHLLASLVALPESGAGDDRPMLLEAYLGSLGHEEQLAWPDRARERLAAGEGPFATLAVLDVGSRPPIEELMRPHGSPRLCPRRPNQCTACGLGPESAAPRG